MATLHANMLIDTAADFLKSIHELGYEAYIVGGAVRDLILKVDVNDIDVATNCPMDVLRSHFKTHDITKKSNFEHLNFGVLLVAFQGELYEVAQFRTEKGYDGRRPSEVSFVQSLEEDVKRRDFTINALAMDADGKVIDYVGGLLDLERRIIRAVGDPNQRFREDYLRVIRAARFASKEGFVLDKSTFRAAKKMAANITKMSPERISMEFTKAAKMLPTEFAQFIRTLSHLRVLHRIMPEVEALRYCKHDNRFHPEGNAFEHTVKTIESLPECPSTLDMLSALLHDVGKSAAFSDEDGLPHYYRHEKIGEIMAEDILTRLRFPSFMIKPICFAVKNHMLFTHIDEMKPAKIARLVSSDYFDVLESVAYADSKCRGYDLHDDIEFECRVLRMKETRDKWEKFFNNKSKEKLVDGRMIMELTGELPGPIIGKMKSIVEDRIVERGVDPEDVAAIERLILEAYNEYHYC